MQVLITGGGTSERIDDVRFITNFSTGATAALIADVFSFYGVQVKLLHGKNAQVGSGNYEREGFEGFVSLNEILKHELETKSYDAVIHLAAVSDYSVESVELNGKKYAPRDLRKLDSEGGVSLHLKKNFKILDCLKAYSQNKKLCVVGFKLTSQFSEEERQKAVTKLLSSQCVDFVVHNDLSEIKGEMHLATLYDNQQNVIQKTQNKNELALSLLALLRGRV